ncbi:MAG: glycosyltransferase family 2 protein [Parvularcula sp.]|jgi:glycosyltransferase involved in cell wall biosynthesis|nr:glycosyltransferase family 2 protein [Parvularcula sp.]
MPEKIVVVVPAHNEEQRLPETLRSLLRAAAFSPLPVNIFVFVNNSSDGTAAAVRSLANSGVHSACSIVLEGVHLPAARAHAGGARAAGTAWAVRQFDLHEDDIILSTDADTVVPVHTFRTLAEGFSRAADVMLARINCVADPYDPAPAAALDYGTPHVEWRCRVRQLVEAKISGERPNPAIHDDYGAAGLAFTVAAYHRIGGFEPIPCNEDKAFVAKADMLRLRVDRGSRFEVMTSTRLNGRASGGMAAALRHNALLAHEKRPVLVEPHRRTIERIERAPSHAAAFDPTAPETECVQRAIQGLDAYLSHFTAPTEDRSCVA